MNIESKYNPFSDQLRFPIQREFRQKNDAKNSSLSIVPSLFIGKESIQKIQRTRQLSFETTMPL